MAVVPLGEYGFLVRGLGGLRPFEVAARLRAMAIPAGVEVVPGLDSVGVYGPVSQGDLQSWLSGMEGTETVAVAEAVHEIPVCLTLGLDTDTVLATLDLDLAELSKLIAGAEMTCEAIGFQPGFPYLSGLPKPLRGLPRRPQPRPRVPRGSVGITGDSCGIYPADVPGGWNLIGQTPFEIADLGSGYFPIRPGDRIRWRVIAEQEFLAGGGRLA